MKFIIKEDKLPGKFGPWYSCEIYINNKLKHAFGSWSRTLFHRMVRQAWARYE